MDVKEILARVGEELSVRRVFGEPFERDGALIVPAAVVAGGGGGGVDPKGAPTPDGTSTDDAPDQPSDLGKKQPAAGAGYGGYVRALGVYAIKDGQVRFVPAVNATALAIAGILSVAAVVTARTLRARSR